MTAAFASDPAATGGNAPMKMVTEKALAAQKEALAIEGMLRLKLPDMAAAAARAEALHQHVTDMQGAAQALDGATSARPDVTKMKMSVDVLKVLTGNKAKELAGADASERARFRGTAKNIAMRVEDILKTSRKAGG